MSKSCSGAISHEVGTLACSLNNAIQQGELCWLSPALLPGNLCPVLLSAEKLPELRAGDVFYRGDQPLFVDGGATRLPGQETGVACRLLKAVQDVEAGEEIVCTVRRTGFSVAWITLSDKGAAGLRVDESGPLIGELVRGKMEVSHEQGFVLPDEEPMLRSLLVELALSHGYDFIFTTGGTGLGPRDVTPEATLAVIEKRLPGFERAMTAEGLSKTPHAAISRAVAGTLGHSVIVNMPGSPKAVRESLGAVLPALKHASEKLKGDPSDCARLS